MIIVFKSNFSMLLIDYNINKLKTKMQKYYKRKIIIISFTISVYITISKKILQN